MYRIIFNIREGEQHVRVLRVWHAFRDAITAGDVEEWDAETLSSKRYAISDLVDDLRDPRNAIEAAAIIGKLHEQLGNFYFRSRGVWSASGKHIPRLLEKVDAALSTRWEEAFLDALGGQRNKLILLTEEVLLPHGGFLFEGYRQEARPDWRLANFSHKG